MVLLDMVNADRRYGEDPLTSRSYDDIIHLIKTAQRPFKLYFERVYKAVLTYGAFPAGSGIKVEMGDNAWYTAAPNQGTPSLIVRTGEKFSDKVIHPGSARCCSVDVAMDVRWSPTFRKALR